MTTGIPKSKKRIVIVEDNHVVREGISMIISEGTEHLVVAAYDNSEEAVVNLSDDKPDIVFMDIELKGELNGIEGTRLIKNKNPRTQVVIITSAYDNEKVFNALCNGATGYLTKHIEADTLIRSINEVAEGGAPMSMRIAKMVVESFRRTPVSSLSEKEELVLRYLADGRTYSDISESMGVSKNTVKFHIKNIYEVLGAHSKAEAIAQAKKMNIISSR